MSDIDAKPSLGGAVTKRRWATALSAIFALAMLAVPTVVHSVFGIGVSPVLSASMQPLAAPGDLLITKATPAVQLKPGEIVTLTDPASGSQYAHRIVSIKPVSGVLQIVTKGDANPAADQTPIVVAESALIPKSIDRIKWVGNVVVFLASKTGQALGKTLLIASGVFTLLFFVLKRSSREEEGRPGSNQALREVFQEVPIRTSTAAARTSTAALADLPARTLSRSPLSAPHGAVSGGECKLQALCRFYIPSSSNSACKFKQVCTLQNAAAEIHVEITPLVHEIEHHLAKRYLATEGRRI
ncbi:MAG TPA: signal peptidase I [archaeon]|nr:signal peptidase I [archaeon]